MTLIGADLTIDEVGRRAGTIGYEILTSLGRRYAPPLHRRVNDTGRAFVVRMDGREPEDMA